MLNLGNFLKGTAAMPVVVSDPDPDDVLLTVPELSVRWRLEESTLANARSKGEGIPYIKLPTGPIRYKLSDVLDAERAGNRGFTWEALNDALKDCPGLSANMRAALITHARRRMK